MTETELDAVLQDTLHNFRIAATNQCGVTFCLRVIKFRPEERVIIHLNTSDIRWRAQLKQV